MKPFIPMATIMVMLFFHPTLQAQTGKQITIDEAVSMALNNNLEMKASGFEIQSAQSLKRTTKELPKTDVNYQFGQYNSIKFDNAVQLSQTVPFPTLFAARKNLISAEIKGKELNREATAYEIKAQVRNYYYQILYLQTNKVKLQYLDSLYIDFVNASAVRYKAGESKQLEKTTAETKRGEINLLLKQNETDIANAYASLKAWMNSNEDFMITDNSALFKPLSVSVLIDSAVIANNPSIKLLYQDAVIAEQNKKVEKAQGLPDFKLGYSNQSLIGFQTINGQDKYFGAGKRYHVGNIGISIPLTYGATKARIKSLDYQRQAYEAAAQNQQKQVMAQLQNALQQYNQYLLQYNYYVTQALPNAKAIIDAAKLGFRTGDINYVEYLLALQTSTDIELNYLQAIQQLNQTVITINYLTNK